MSDNTSFSFDAASLARAQQIVARYPEDRQASAVIPLLDLAQRKNGGWLSQAAIEHVADFLRMPRMRAHEVATFYTMFIRRPVGDHLVQLCRTTPCWLRGSDAIRDAVLAETGCGLNETSADGKFSVIEVECLGACCNAPMIQIGDHFYEDLTPEKTRKILVALRRGESPKAGSQTGRQSSEPSGGLTTLTSAAAGVQ